MQTKNKLKIKKIAAWACIIAIAAPLVFFACYYLIAPKHEHDFKLVYTTATCEYAGQGAYFCQCGASQIKDEPALGHDYGQSNEYSRLNACTRKDCLSGRMTPPEKDFTEKMLYDFGDGYKNRAQQLYTSLLSFIEQTEDYLEGEHEYDTQSSLYQDNLQFEKIFDEYEDCIDEITAQYQYAKVFYNIDMKNEELKEEYLSVSQYRTNTVSAYYSLFSKIYASALRNYFYRNYTQEQIDRVLYQSECVGNERYTALKNRNAQIEVEVDSIENLEASTQFSALYAEFVQNNNQIAQIFGYENYLDYAYESVYDREYSYLDAEQTSKYIKEHLSPNFGNLVAKLYQLFAETDQWTQADVNDYNGVIVYSFFDNVIANGTVNDFAKKMSGSGNKKQISLSQELNDLFKNGNYFLGNYPGAYEWYLYDLQTPIVFWGEGYQSAFTVVHELGHYLNDTYNQSKYSMSYDLLETHSQGNEMLYLSYLKQHASSTAFNLIKCDRLYDSLLTIINTAAVNAFEQAIYTGQYGGANAQSIMADGQITASEYDLLFVSILQDFGINQFVNNSYWRHVTVKSPCYYISYSVSMACSLQLLIKAEEDGFDAAAASYFKLITYTDEHSKYDYKQVLKHADLYSYDEEELYISIKNYLNWS
ncbi:MAG: hypothetical protein E7370_00975 [Clostridiales bacterium]|nr:hypothetical protein [Clostridiales bacterium]